MSNLGRYQDIVEEASRAGGVDNWLQLVEREAVEEAAPKMIGVGTLVAFGLMGTALLVKRLVDKRMDRRKLAERAREQLQEEVEAALNSQDDIEENLEDSVE